MKLITKAIEKKLSKFPLYSTDGQENKEVIVKFFGSVDLGYGSELGYFRLSELQSIRLPFGLSIERDMYL